MPHQLMALAWPVIGLNVLNVLALGVDTAMIGRIEGAEAALAGLGFATQVVFLVMVLMMGLTVGTVATVARAWGAGKGDQVAHVLRQSGQLTVIVGLAVALVGNLLGEPTLRLMGASGQSLAFALDYLRPLLLFAVFNYLNILYGAVLRGVGNTRLAFVIAILSNGINFGLNYALILGNFGMPAMGVQGAAIGTVLSHAFAVALMIAMMRTGRARATTRSGEIRAVPLPLRPAPLDLDLARTLGRVGAPAALDMVVLNAGFLSIVGMLGQIGDAAVAAHGVGLRVQALAFVPGMSVAQATGALVGQALGAGDVERARKVVWASVALCGGIMSTLAVLIIGGASPIIQIFDVLPGSPLFAYTRTWMILLGACMPVVGIYIAFVGLFQGSGATRISLRINSVATFLVQIPLSWFLGFPLGLGAFGVWLAFPLSFLVKAALGAYHYRKGEWAVTGARPA